MTDAAAALTYAVHLDIKFDALDRIDVPSLVKGRAALSRSHHSKAL